MRAEIGAQHVTWQTVLGHRDPEVCSGQFYASPELKSYHGNGLGQSVCGQLKPVMVVFLLLARKEEPIMSAVPIPGLQLLKSLELAATFAAMGMGGDGDCRSEE